MVRCTSELYGEMYVEMYVEILNIRMMKVNHAIIIYVNTKIYNIN